MRSSPLPHDTPSGNAANLDAADWLNLAAAPAFAIMALLMGVLGGGRWIYLLMSAFHSAHWLKRLISVDHSWLSSAASSKS